MPIPTLTDIQFKAIFELYHECNAAFRTLGQEWQEAFFDVLHKRSLPERRIPQKLMIERKL